jgi:hypothetical protein
MENTFMMTLDYVGDREAMVYAQLGQQPLVRTTATSPEPRPGTLSCLSARPPDLAFWTGTRPQVVGVSPTIVPFLYSKRTAAARSLVSRYGRSIVLSPLRANRSWTYPERVRSRNHTDKVYTSTTPYIYHFARLLAGKPLIK